MDAIHTILFNAHILYSVILGGWAFSMAVRNESVSGSFWGAVATYAILAGLTLAVGTIMALMGLRPASDRMLVYYLYMIWLVIIMPGLFSLLRGRDDRSAAIAFALLAFFNIFTSISMVQRAIVMPWIEFA